MQADKISYAGVGAAAGGVIGIIGVMAKWFTFSMPLGNGVVTYSLSATADWTGSLALAAALGAFAFGGAYILFTDPKIRRVMGACMSVCAVFLLAFSLFGYTRIGEAVGVPAAQFTTHAGRGLALSFVGGVIAVVSSLLASLDLFGAADAAEPQRDVVEV
jgi:hypothetical protein